MLTRLRHEFLALLVAAFAGIVVTMLVAWACQLRSSVSIVDVNPTGGGRSWPSAFPAGTGNPGYWHVSGGFGRSGELFAVSGGSRMGGPEKMVFIQSAGWPARAVKMVRWTDPTTSAEVSEYSATLPKTGALPEWAAGQPVPVMPQFPGFLVDVLLYAAGVWCFLRGVRWLKGIRRRRAGHCPGCGYPLGGAAICSECGSQ